MCCNKIFAYIKETFTYWVAVCWWNSWLYQHMVFPVEFLKKDIANSTSIAEAERMSKKRFYRYVSKSYKKRLIYEKFN